MRKRMLAGLLATTAGLVVFLSGPTDRAGAQEKAKGNTPKHLYGHNPRVRPGGETDWPKALTIGVEVFEENGTKAIVAVSDAGAIAATPPTAAGPDRKNEWKLAHDLRCRKAGEIDRTQKTKQWGVELFHDRSINKLLYVCESGSVALAPVPAGLVTDKGPALHHAMDLRVRLHEQIEFKDAKRFGVEAFKDENTGGLIYITEVGAIATAPAPAMALDPKNQQGPKALYGLDLRVRGSEEAEFTDKTKRIGVEVFEDPNAKTLVYISETGFIAALPLGKFVDGARGVTWKSGAGMRARKGGQEKFEEAKKFGIEVFVDNRTENLIFISETGSIAVLPK